MYVFDLHRLSSRALVSYYNAQSAQINLVSLVLSILDAHREVLSFVPQVQLVFLGLIKQKENVYVVCI